MAKARDRSGFSAWSSFRWSMIAVAISGVLIGWQLRKNEPIPDVRMPAGTLVPVELPARIAIELTPQIKDNLVPVTLTVNELVAIPGAGARGVHSCSVKAEAFTGVAATHVHLRTNELTCVSAAGNQLLVAPLVGVVADTLSGQTGFTGVQKDTANGTAIVVERAGGQRIGSLLLTREAKLHWEK